MLNPEYVLENETHKPLEFWDTNRSLNLGQNTRPSDSQPKKEKLPNSDLWGRRF